MTCDRNLLDVVEAQQVTAMTENIIRSISSLRCQNSFIWLVQCIDVLLLVLLVMLLCNRSNNRELLGVYSTHYSVCIIVITGFPTFYSRITGPMMAIVLSRRNV